MKRLFTMSVAVLALGLAAPGVYAVAPASLSQAPLFLVTSATPQVMLSMSNDHQLFYKAYDDWSDVDGDGLVDTTYDHTIDYYGYFDAYKCYDYDNASGRFEPIGITADKYCDSVAGADWSGNFLNWATMSRIDVVRKILFGGYRSSDTAALTVLERAYLPGDAHSFAKYYSTNTVEMGKLTPWSVGEITLCNTTYAADHASENRSEPPLIRVARGNFALWAANERYQCHWDDHGETEGTRKYTWGPYVGKRMNNGNNPAESGLDAFHSNPSWSGDDDGDGNNDRLGDGDYIVRVEACVSTALAGQEKCKVYPDGNLKPIGLLQEYGDDAEIDFGLLTGSYQKNKSGGTLRKNVSPLTDEINTTTDGTFKAAPATGNIISNLNALRVSGYDHNPGYYNSMDNCSWGKNSFNNGSCTNWGNPQAEIYLETLRYFAGASANGSFAADDSSYINGFIAASSWDDPLSSDNYCAPVNVIQFNASVTSYDNDELGGSSDLGIASLDTWTDKVGTGEGIAGNEYFIGEGSATSNGLCTSKTLNNLSDAEGLCPEAPRLDGGYAIAGLAHYARVNSIRSDIFSPDDALTPVDITVNTYGVTLSPAVPKIEVPVPGSNTVLTILPACRNQSVNGNCAIVDFKVVQEHTEVAGVATAKFYVNWEDSEQGGDYDQDMAGVLSYSVDATNITVTTDAIGQSTPNKMGFGYVISGTTQDGFHAHSGINGFNQNIEAAGVTSCNSLGSCNMGAAATSYTYTIGAGAGSLLEDPLYYAAKWGGFTEDDTDTANGGSRPVGDALPNDVPDQDYEWDADGDGLPDSYFYSTNPSELETSLAAVFLDVAAQLSSSSSTAANSQRVSTDTTIYQSRFNSVDWSGELLAYQVNIATGALSAVANWDAGSKLESIPPANRYILSYLDGTGGILFDWGAMDATQQGYLDLNPDTLVADGLGEERVDYLRGDDADEVQSGGTFRDRSRILGDLINSSPAYVGAPGFGYPDWLEVNDNASAETYTEFKSRMAALNANAGRTEMLYVGGNDGMLHGFTAASSAVTGGVEKLAYVPNVLYPALNQLTSADYSHRYYVDGSPTVGDVMFTDDDWHTMLVSGLNAGGKGIFALDVTNPATFTDANVSSIVLWEISSSTAGFAELGYTFSRPALVKNHAGIDPYNYAAGDGKWVAIFGNGYASASGHAILYIVDAQTGALIETVVAESITGDNGLSTVSPVDIDGDHKIDVIYAGDLKGNVWKFIPDGTQTGWKLDFGGSPLFTAPADPTATIANTQPITARIEVGRHPEGKPGLMVYFGTGSYFQVGDNVASADRDSVYGIWDAWNKCNNFNTGTGTGSRRAACSSSYSVGGASPPAVPSISRSNLLKQCVTSGTLGDTCLALAGNAAAGNVNTGSASGTEVRVVSQNELDAWHWSSGSGYMGWYLDLPDYGEKQVTRHILRAGRLIFVSIIPSDHSCKDGGESWLWELDPASGGRLDVTVFDLNGDGAFDTSDEFQAGAGSPNLKVSAKKSPTGIIQPPSIVTSPDGGKEYKYSSSSAGNIEVTTENPGKVVRGRKSWMRIK